LPTPRTPWTNFRIGRTDAAPPFWGFVAFTPVQSAARWFHVFSPPFRGAFQLSLTLLIYYRSRGVFRVRGSCPRSSGGISNPPYSASGITLVSPLRDCHPLRWPVPGHFTLRRSGGPRHHIPMDFHPRVRFALFRFRSPLLTESRLFSFPLPTKMLQFGRLPFANANALASRRSH
jgi:hypothetical protein